MRPSIKSFKKARPVAFFICEKIKKTLKLALKNTKSPVILGFQMYQYLYTDLVGHLGLEPRTDRL